MKTMTIIDAGQYVVFLEETGDVGKQKAIEIIKSNPELHLYRIVEAIQYTPDIIVPGMIYDRETGIPYKPSVELWDGATEEEMKHPVEKTMINRYIDTYGQAHLFCEMHALFRTEYTFDVPGVPYDACEHCGIQNLDPTTEAGYLDDTLHPIPITGPGWYRTANGERVHITKRNPLNMTWVGTIYEDTRDEWRNDGTNYVNYHPWMIVKKEDV